MHKKVGQVGRILSRYAAGACDRLGTLLSIQRVGYTRQTAIFIMDLLEESEETTTIPFTFRPPCSTYHSNGGNPDDKT